MKDINMGQAIGAQGFPSLILKNESGYRFIALDYNDANVTLAQLGLETTSIKLSYDMGQLGPMSQHCLRIFSGF